MKTLFSRPHWFRSEKPLHPTHEPPQNDKLLESSCTQPEHLYLPIREVTAWDHRSFSVFLIDCIVATLWGTALLIFAIGVVPITYSISQWGKGHLEIVQFVVTVVATITTAHREWDLFTRFPGYYKLLWVLFWVSMNLHTASVASIMQPSKFVGNVYFDDLAPCGIQSDNITFDSDPVASISPVNQGIVDQSAFAIGLQLGTYYQALRWNTTTIAFGRPYVKENISYGSGCGLHDGLFNVSGVLFDVQCATSGGKYGQDAMESVWARTFPDRSFPTLQITSHDSSTISGSFDDPPVNTPSLQSVVSSTPFNLTVSSNSRMAFYSLVDARGNGGMLGVTATNTMACTWLAIPKQVQVIIVHWVARSYAVENATSTPQYLGRAVLATIKGMAQAALTGARLDQDNGLVNEGLYTYQTPSIPTTAEMLGVLLADGVKSALTGFYALANKSEISLCPAHVRTINDHWCFGNQHQLGWIAVILTLGAGISGFVTLGHSRKKRVTGVEGLDRATIFMLGMDSNISKMPKEQLKDTALKFQEH